MKSTVYTKRTQLYCERNEDTSALRDTFPRPFDKGTESAQQDVMFAVTLCGEAEKKI